MGRTIRESVYNSVDITPLAGEEINQEFINEALRNSNNDQDKQQCQNLLDSLNAPNPQDREQSLRPLKMNGEIGTG